MERVGEMTRAELKQLVARIVDERVARLLCENGFVRRPNSAARDGRTWQQRLDEVERNRFVQKPGAKSGSQLIIEEREAIRNWKPSRKLTGSEWITEERKLRGSSE